MEVWKDPKREKESIIESDISLKLSHLNEKSNQNKLISICFMTSFMQCKRKCYQM